MAIKNFFRVLHGAFLIFLIALGLISIRLSINQKDQYLHLIIGSLVILSAIVVVSLITIKRKVNKPIQMLRDATHRVATNISQLTQVATGLANGDLSRTLQIHTQPLESNTK